MIESLFNIYGIEEVLINDGDKVEIIILKRKVSLTMNRWINFINELKRIYQKEVEFLTLKNANFMYDNDLSMFRVMGGNNHE